MNSIKLASIILRRFALWQAVVFCGLLLVSSCRNDSLLGLELQPEGQFDSLQLTDTFSVRGFTVKGSRQRSDEAQSYFGAITSSQFGYSQSNLVFNLAGATGIFGDSLVVSNPDAVVLQLRPNKIYGNPSSSIPLEVVQLDEPLQLADPYFSDTTFRVREKILGSTVLSRSSQIQPTDTSIVNGDTIPYVIRIPLSLDVGTEIMTNLGNPWNDEESFQNGFNGLMLRIPENSSISQGAIYSFALLTGESMIMIYYTTPDGDKEVLEFPVSSTCSRINLFEHDYSGSLASSYLASSSKNEDILFVQGLSGLESEIQIPGLQSFGKTSLTAISKATLSFNLADEQPSEYSPSQRLYLLELDEDGSSTLTPDFIDNSARSGGFYSSANNGFSFDITRHVQRVVQSANEGGNINYGLRLRAQVPVLNGNDTSHNVIQGLDNIVLKVYHTDLNN